MECQHVTSTKVDISLIGISNGRAGSTQYDDQRPPNFASTLKFEVLVVRNSEGQSGIGLQYVSGRKAYIVTSMFVTSPASGLIRLYDEITHIDTISIESLEGWKVRELLDGTPGTMVMLGVLRGAGKLKAVPSSMGSPPPQPAVDKGVLQLTRNEEGKLGMGFQVPETFAAGLDGLPAAAAGIRAGDELLGVDNVRADTLQVQQLSFRLKGPPHSQVLLHLGPNRPILPATKAVAPPPPSSPPPLLPTSGGYEDPWPLKALRPQSRVIAAKLGQFDYGDRSLLIPHEALRLLTERTRRVLVHYDPARNAWQTERLRLWLEDFLLPFVHEHHDAEEQIFFPFYHKLGARNEAAAFTADHVVLMRNLEAVRAVVQTRDGAKTRAAFESMAEHLLKHLDQEEAFWPNEVRRFGPERLLEVEKAVVAAAMKKSSPAMLAGLVCILEAMGCAPTGEHPRHGWASQRVKDEFRSTLPWVVRVMVYPSWVRRYRFYTDTLLSILNDKELPVQPPAAGCACVVS